MAGDPRAYSANPRELANPVPGVAQQDSLDNYMGQAKIPNAPAPSAQAPAAAAPPQQGGAPAQQSAKTDSLDAYMGNALPNPGTPQLPKQDQSPPPQSFFADAKEFLTTGDAMEPSRGSDGMNRGMLTTTDSNDPALKQIHDAYTQIKDLFTLPREQMVAKIRQNVANGDGGGISRYAAQTLLANTIGMPDQLNNLGAQSIARVGQTPEEQQKLLDANLGKGTSFIDKDGLIHYKAPGDTKFQPISQPGFELLGDTVGNPRQMIREGVAAPFEVAGAALGGMVGFPTAGASVGRMIAQPFGNMAADAVMKGEGGEVDSTRNRFYENAAAVFTEGAFSLVANKIKYMLPGTTEAEQALARKQITIPQITDQVNSVRDDFTHLDNTGLMQTIDAGVLDPKLKGKKVSLMAHQIFTNDAEVQRAAVLGKDTPQVQNFQNMQVNNLVSATKNMGAVISGFTGDNPDALVENLGSIVKGIDRAEGQTIGSFKAKAMAQLGNEKLPVPQQLQQNVAAMWNGLGLPPPTRSADGKSLIYAVPNDIRPLLGKFGITKAGDMRSFINTLQDYAQTSSTGLRIDEIDRLVNTVGNLNGVAGRNGGQVAAAWGQFAGDLRQFRRDAIGAGLVNDVDVRGFNTAMDKFGALRDASNTLSRTLDGDFTVNSIVQQVLNKGQAGLANFRAIKTLVKDDSPQTYAAIKQAWVDDMFRRYSTPSGNTPYNFAGMQKELSGYGDTFLNEVLDGSGIGLKDVRAMMNVAQHIQSTFLKVGAPMGLDEKAKQAAFNTLAGAVASMPMKTLSGFQSAIGLGVAGNPYKTLLDPNEIAMRLAKYDGPGDRSVIEDNLKKMIATSMIYSKIPMAMRAADITSRNAVKRWEAQKLQSPPPAPAPAPAPEEQPAQ